MFSEKIISQQATGEVATTRRRDYISAAWAVIYQVSTLLICYSEAIICLSWQYKDSGQKVRGRIFREQVTLCWLLNGCLSPGTN